MSNHSLCGILRKNGSDCDIPVAAGSPFNVCPKHYAKIHVYLRDAVATYADRHHLRDTVCPDCGVRALIASITERTATCQSCDLKLTADEVRALAEDVPTERDTGPLESIPTMQTVYYLRISDVVKIGYTTRLDQRLLAYPPFAELLATEPGDQTLERERHWQFRADLMSGREWFRYSPALQQHIDSLRGSARAA